MRAVSNLKNDSAKHKAFTNKYYCYIIAPHKMVFPTKGTENQQKVLIFILFLHENICCGYSLEAHPGGEFGASVHGEIRKL